MSFYGGGKEMKEDLLKIINHYGVLTQLKYFYTEIYELTEAIITQELDESGYNYEIEHIAEEIADVLVMLRQFIEYYDINEEKIYKIFVYKMERQIERIEKEGDDKNV